MLELHALQRVEFAVFLWVLVHVVQFSELEVDVLYRYPAAVVDLLVTLVVFMSCAVPVAIDLAAVALDDSLDGVVVVWATCFVMVLFVPEVLLAYDIRCPISLERFRLMLPHEFHFLQLGRRRPSLHLVVHCL